MVGHRRSTSIPTRSNVRPDEYPVSILWTWTDCLNDALAIPDKPGNKSRPAIMDRAIRTEDGTEIDNAEWKNTILETAHVVVHRVIIPLPIPDYLPPTTSRTRELYRDHYHSQWYGAIEELERLQPLLALCPNHWKARKPRDMLWTTDSQFGQIFVTPLSPSDSGSGTTPAVSTKPKIETASSFEGIHQRAQDHNGHGLPQHEPLPCR